MCDEPEATEGTTSVALEKRPPDASLQRIEITAQKIELIGRQLMPGANAGEIAVFIEYARRTGLDPFTRQIHAFKTSSHGREVWQFSVGIDGLRLIAQRTGLYRGSVGPYWKARGDQWVELWEPEKAGEPPYAAKAGVLRVDREDPQWAIVKFSSFARRNRQGDLIGNWKSMPEHMLAKCAEAQALRRAFPNETSGLYIEYEQSRVMVNPDAPATHDQIGELHRLGRDLGWTDDERRERQGGRHANDLTKREASDYIDLFASELAAKTNGDPPPAVQRAKGGGPSDAVTTDPTDPESGLPNIPLFPAGPYAGVPAKELALKHPQQLAELIANAGGKRRSLALAWMEWLERRDKRSGAAASSPAGASGGRAEGETAASDPSDDEIVDGEVVDESADDSDPFDVFNGLADDEVAPHEFVGADQSGPCDECAALFEHPAHHSSGAAAEASAPAADADGSAPEHPASEKGAGSKRQAGAAPSAPLRPSRPMTGSFCERDADRP